MSRETLEGPRGAPASGHAPDRSEGPSDTEPARGGGGGSGSDDGHGRSGGGGGGEGGSGSGAGGPGTTRRRTRRWLAEWAVIVVVAVVVAFLVRTFVAQTYFIPSTSMYPTLEKGDRIIVDKLAFDFGSVHRGDIVVFRRPPAEDCGGSPVPDLVKRVIGLPGDVISAHDGHVYVNGKELQQPWLPKTSAPFSRANRTYTTAGPYLAHPYHVPAGDYFMMGDDRQISCDSRMWGPVKRSYIVGKVDVIVWPLSQFRLFF